MVRLKTITGTDWATGRPFTLLVTHDPDDVDGATYSAVIIKGEEATGCGFGSEQGALNHALYLLCTAVEVTYTNNSLIDLFKPKA